MNTGTTIRVTAMIKSAGLNQAQLGQLAELIMQEKQSRAKVMDVFGKGLGAVGNMFKRPPAPTARVPSPLPTTPRSMPVAPAQGPAGAFGYNPAAEARKVQQAMRPPAPPTGAPPMSFGKRLGIGAAGGGAVGGGAVLGGGHLHNDAQQTVGRTINPFTWHNPNTEEDVFRTNMDKLREQSEGLQTEMGQTTDPKKLMELNDKMISGDYGGSRWRMGGLNPFADRKAKSYQDAALGAQDALQTKLDAARAGTGPQQGDEELLRKLDERLAGGRLLPGQAEAMERQRAMLRQRMESAGGMESPDEAAIIKRMQESKMRIAPGKPRPTSPTAYGAWQTGHRPGAGHGQGFGKTPYAAPPQKKPFNPWEDVIPSESSNPNLMFG